MTRWLPVIAAGCLLALATIAVVATVRPAPPATPAARADALAAELRCPDCQGLSVADSPTSSAREIRRQIDELIAAGASDDEVRAHFVARYGEWIRLAPSGPALWLLPFGVVLAGVALLGAWLVRRRGEQPAQEPLSAEQRQRLHDEAEALDA
jgi:cytochrome c-type biogenesis protein CcmH